MYDPFDQNKNPENDTNHLNHTTDTDPSPADAPKEEVSAPAEGASGEYHYTGDTLHTRAGTEESKAQEAAAPSYTAPQYGSQQGGYYPGQQASYPQAWQQYGTASQGQQQAHGAYTWNGAPQQGSPNLKSPGTAKRPNVSACGWWRRCCAACWSPSRRWGPLP